MSPPSVKFRRSSYSKNFSSNGVRVVIVYIILTLVIAVWSVPRYLPPARLPPRAPPRVRPRIPPRPVGSTSSSVISQWPEKYKGSWKLVRKVSGNSSCFQQGLLNLKGDVFFRSCGGYGSSRVELVDFSSDREKLLLRRPLPPWIFAEGLAIGSDELFVLTWREDIVIALNPQTLEFGGIHNHTGEGWGLAYDPGSERLIESNGTGILNVLQQSRSDDSSLLRSQESIQIDCWGYSPNMLNELDMSQSLVFSNVWHSNVILIIDPTTAKCVAWLDFSELAELQPVSADVFNGIAIQDSKIQRIGSEKSILSARAWVGGKLWPATYLVDLEVNL